MLDGTFRVLNVSKNAQDEWNNKYHLWKSDPLNNVQPRVRIAKHHFPIELATRDLGEKHQLSWVHPITEEEADELKCYNHIPSQQVDFLLKYDTSLGKGQSARSRKKYEGKTLLRIVPCASVTQVTNIAAELQNNITLQNNIALYQQNNDATVMDRRLALQMSEDKQNQPYKPHDKSQSKTQAKVKPDLLNIGMQALQYLEEEASNEENPPKRKKQKTTHTAFSSEIVSFDDHQFAQEVAMEFRRRGYVVGLKLEAIDGESSAAAASSPDVKTLPIGVLFHPNPVSSTKKPTSDAD